MITGKKFVFYGEHEEAEYVRLVELSAKLGLPVFQVYLGIDVTGKDGLTSRMVFRSRTWNRNFWNMVMQTATNVAMAATNYGAGYISRKDTAAAVAAMPEGAYGLNLSAPVGQDAFGILLGTGTGSENFEGYGLTAKIAQGTGSGQFSYQAHSAVSQSYNAGSKTWSITILRLLNNNSSGDITVAEMGLFGRCAYDNQNIMINRDKLVAAVVVVPGAQITARYLTTLTLPA